VLFRSIDLYDLHFTYNLEILKKVKENYYTKTGLLPFAFDVSQELYDICAQETEITKVCFVGNPDKQRASFLKQLAVKGIEIDIFGYNWDKFVSHNNITIHAPIYGDIQWKTLRKYRVQLNIMRVHNLDSHNMRTFEIPGIGGIQLAPKTKEHDLFFEADKEIFLYNTLDECINKINYLLSLTNEQANQYREFAREVCIKNKHSYKDRALQVMAILKTL
jgi:spore maturation protein CgeB